MGGFLLEAGIGGSRFALPPYTLEVFLFNASIALALALGPAIGGEAGGLVNLAFPAGGLFAGGAGN